MKDRYDTLTTKAERIEKQVEYWELFGKLSPVLFLTMSFILLFFDIVKFDTLFKAALIIFSITAITWWFWTINSVRYLIKRFNQAAEDLIKVSEELKEIKNEYRKLNNHENYHN